MDIEIVKILSKYGCKYMADDNKEMLEEIVNFAKEQGKALIIDGVVFNEAENDLDIVVNVPHKTLGRYSLKKIEGSEVELTNRCKSCGRTDEERLTMTSMCGVSACPY